MRTRTSLAWEFLENRAPPWDPTRDIGAQGDYGAGARDSLEPVLKNTIRSRKRSVNGEVSLLSSPCMRHGLTPGTLT